MSASRMIRPSRNCKRRSRSSRACCATTKVRTRTYRLVFSSMNFVIEPVHDLLVPPSRLVEVLRIQPASEYANLSVIQQDQHRICRPVTDRLPSRWNQQQDQRGAGDVKPRGTALALGDALLQEASRSWGIATVSISTTSFLRVPRWVDRRPPR